MSDTTSRLKIVLVTDNCDGWSAHNRCKNLDRLLTDIDTPIVQGSVHGSREIILKHILEGAYIHLHYSAGIAFFWDFITQYPKRFFITLGNERGYYENYCGIRSRIEQVCEIVAGVTSVSERLAKDLKVLFIPNGVNLDLFSNAKRVVVGYVGTEKNNKNYELFLAVCEKMGVEPLALTYNNRIDHTLMPEQYRNMDLLLHPSKTEGCNNVILEALAMNVPVYMTKEGIWDMLEGYVTFIEPTFEAMCDIIRKHQGRKLIQSKFDWSQRAKEYREFYRAVLGK